MAQQPAHWPDDPDQQDPPVGVSIRPLHQLPDLRRSAPTIPAFAPFSGEPAGGSYGTAGASALAHYRQLRAREWAAFVRTLPWRLAGVIAAGGLAGTLTHGAGPRLAGPAAALAAGALGWWLRFRVSAETAAWRRGARGERRTARRLRKLVQAGWTVLHDLAIPGSRANGDHLLIGPPGVFLVDSKAWHGTITMRPNAGHRQLGSPTARHGLGRARVPDAVCPRHPSPMGRGVRGQRPRAHPRQAAGLAAVTPSSYGRRWGDAAGRARPPPAAPRNLSRASCRGIPRVRQAPCTSSACTTSTPAARR